MWGLANIAGENAIYRDILLDAGIVNEIVWYFNQNLLKTQSQLQTLSWALSNLCRFKPPPVSTSIKPLIPIINNLMSRKFENDEIHFDLLWAISYISDQGAIGRELIIKN